jgi:hypothetical protein
MKTTLRRSKPFPLSGIKRLQPVYALRGCGAAIPSYVFALVLWISLSILADTLTLVFVPFLFSASRLSLTRKINTHLREGTSAFRVLNEKFFIFVGGSLQLLGIQSNLLHVDSYSLWSFEK